MCYSIITKVKYTHISGCLDMVTWRAFSWHEFFVYPVFMHVCLTRSGWQLRSGSEYEVAYLYLYIAEQTGIRDLKVLILQSLQLAHELWLKN